MKSKLKLYTSANIETVTVPDNNSTIAIVEGYASVYKKPDGSLQVDRDDEVINTDNIDVDDYNNNPVLLFNHDWNKVIGRVTEIEKDNRGLKVKAEVHKLTGYEAVYEGVVKGLIKSFSVGLVPQDYNFLSDDIVEIASANLFEISLAPVQSNPSTLFSVTSTKSLGVSAKLLAEQNDMTCDELKGQCNIAKALNISDKQEKENKMDIKTKEMEQPKDASTEQKDAPKVEEPKAEQPKEGTKDVPKVEEPKKEEPVEPKAEQPKEEKEEKASIANDIVVAMQRVEELKAEKIKAEQEAKEREEQEAKERQVRKEQDAYEYIKGVVEQVKNTEPGELDVDKLDDFYSLVSDATQLIESKVSEAIKESAKVSA